MDKLKKVIARQAREIKELRSLLWVNTPPVIKPHKPVIHRRNKRLVIQKRIKILQNRIKQKRDQFWVLNPSDNIQNIIKKIREIRTIHGNKKYNKYIKMSYNNSIKSYSDVVKFLKQIYQKEHNAFKLQISFGYVSENLVNNQIRVYQPSQQFFFEDLQLVRNQSDLDKITLKVSGEEINHKIAHAFQDSSTRLIGVYGMAVKIIRLDYPVGADIKLPDYIKTSRYIVSLESVPNNLCAWACFALMHKGVRRDRYINKAKEMFAEFYKLDERATNDKIKSYVGFDIINEIENFESQSEFAINIIVLNQDSSIKYNRRSAFNETRTPKYLNLHENHLSYVTDLFKLVKAYVCGKCGYRFEMPKHLEQHESKCNVQQNDSFNNKPEIWQCKRNTIVEIADYFDVDIDFKHDYLVTYDLESILLKTSEIAGDKLKYVSTHVPVSVSIATNVPGFEATKFILSKEPRELTKEMFEYFDKPAAVARTLMQEKMQPLIEKINEHYNKDEKEDYLHKINQYTSSIPIVGFNSSFYDTCLLINEGFMREIFSRDKEPFVIKAGSRYRQIKTKQFNFLDQMSYCAPGTNLDSFVRAYDVGETKGYFPYEWFDSYDKLDYKVSDLKIEYFDSSLKCTKLEKSEFNNLIKMCNENSITYVRGLLEWYNNLDVRPLLKSCLKQKEFFYSFKLDMYQDGISLPSLSENIMFQFSVKGFDQYLKQQSDNTEITAIFNTDITRKIENYKQQDEKAKRSLDNYIEVCDVRILLKREKYSCYYCWCPVKFGDNANSWSLDRIDCSKSHTRENCVITCISCNVSRSDTLSKKFYRKKALQRYDRMNPLIHIIDTKNHAVFYKFKENVVGGASIVYHRYHEKNITKITRIRYDQQTKEWTYDKDGKLVKKISGFDANALYLYCLGENMPCGELKWVETNDLKYVTDKDFFGFLEVDISVPEDKYEYFSEMAPIFKNMEYDESNCGEYTQNMVMKLKNKFTSSKKLIGSLSGTKILIKSDRLKWYIDHGCIVTKLYGIIPAVPRRLFKGFMEWVSDERRKGDADIKYAVISECAKIVGNSANGRTIMDKNKHMNIKICDENKFNRLKNKPTFYDAVEYDGLYEVKQKKKTIKQNMAIQIGCTVFDDSKLRMLQFYYDCIDKYIDRSDYQYIEMDTDSAYMALTDDFENLVKPELKEEFIKNKHSWFPRTDTEENKLYDKRTPGLFKIEFEGDGMVALCSKSYYVWRDIAYKCSSKGTQKSRNKSILNKDTYLRCLQNRELVTASNKGFRFTNKRIKTYEQEKVGLTPIYTKGIVFDDGIHIRPLMI